MPTGPKGEKRPADSTVRMSPAMAAGVAKSLMSMADIVALIDAANPLPAKRGPHKKAFG